jgi:hypothetical protein
MGGPRSRSAAILIEHSDNEFGHGRENRPFVHPNIMVRITAAQRPALRMADLWMIPHSHNSRSFQAVVSSCLRPRFCSRWLLLWIFWFFAIVTIDHFNWFSTESQSVNITGQGTIYPRSSRGRWDQCISVVNQIQIKLMKMSNQF